MHGLDNWLTRDDVAAFHALLGLPVQAPSKHALTALVERVLGRLPFQNLCMLAGQRRPPSLAEVRDDMLAGRGGPCGHMNPFLCALLHELGYAVELVSGSMQVPDTHIALIVTLDDERLWIDVGNGFPYLEPIALDDPRPRAHPLIEHRLHARDDGRFEIQHRWPGREGWVRNYEFELVPRAFTFFAEMIAAHYTQPGYGPFLLGLRANAHTRARSVVLRERTLRIIEAGRSDSDKLDDDDRLDAALREHFPGELPLRPALAALASA